MPLIIGFIEQKLNQFLSRLAKVAEEFVSTSLVPWKCASSQFADLTVLPQNIAVLMTNQVSIHMWFDRSNALIIGYSTCFRFKLILELLLCSLLHLPQNPSGT
jgi:hypothetical protein